MFTLLRGLPPTSRYKARLSGQKGGHRWGPTEFLLADLIEQMQAVRLTIIATRPNRRRGSRVPKFVPYPRPTDRDKLDAAEQRNSLAYAYLIQLRPDGPVARGRRIRGPLRAIEERSPPDRSGAPVSVASAPSRARPVGLPSQGPPILSPSERTEMMTRGVPDIRPKAKAVVEWEDVPDSLKGEA